MAYEYTVSSVPALISHIHTVAADFTNKRLAEKGLVSSHGHILYLLAKNGRMTTGDIAAAVNRDKSTITALIRKLKNAGLIREDISAEDSRTKYISLTESGASYRDLTSAISRDLLTVCYRGFSDEEKQALLRLLKKMSANIEDVCRVSRETPL